MTAANDVGGIAVSEPRSFQTQWVPDYTGHWSNRFGAPPYAEGNGVFGTVLALCPFNDGTGTSLYAGGRSFAADANDTNAIAKWNGTAWSPIGSNSAIEYNNGCCADIYDMCSYDDDGPGPNPACLAVVGWFDKAGGSPSYSVARWNPVSLQYQGMGTGLECVDEYNNSCSFVYAAAQWDPDGSGSARPRLVIGGDFDITLSSGRLQNIACWKPETGAWEPLGGGLTWGVRDLLVYDDGTGPALYAATGYDIVRLNSGAWSTVGSADGDVYCLARFDPDGGGSQPTQLYAGGAFSQINSVPAYCIGSWNGSQWSEVGGGMWGGYNISPSVYALTAHDPDGQGPAPEKLYAAGHFYFAGGAAVNHIARLDGEMWSSLNSGFPPVPPPGQDIPIIVYSLGGFEDPTELTKSLFAGGEFWAVGGEYSSKIAQWIPRCVGDFNNDGFVGGDDFDAFVDAFENADPSADMDADGFVTGDDFDIFAASFEAGC